MFAVTVHSTDYSGVPEAPVYILNSEKEAIAFSKQLWEKQMEKDEEYVDKDCSAFNEDTGFGTIISYSTGDTIEYGVSAVSDIRNTEPVKKAPKEDPGNDSRKAFAVNVYEMYAKTVLVPSCSEDNAYAVRMIQKCGKSYIVKANTLDEALDIAEEEYAKGSLDIDVSEVCDTYFVKAPNALSNGFATPWQMHVCRCIEDEKAGSLEEAISIVRFSDEEVSDDDWDSVDISVSDSANPDGTATKKQLKTCEYLN